MTINRDPMTDEDLKTCDAPKHSIDEFKRKVGRNPTRTESKYIARWAPEAAIRQAELNPDGEPDKLVSIKVPNVWEDVSFYCDLAISQVPGSNFGVVQSMRSVRYHDGDDSQWPMRDSNGDLVRNDGGHILQSPMFRTKHMSVMPVTECTWPQGVQDKGMWHVLEILRPMHNQFVGKRPPTHYLTEGLPQNVVPRQSERSEIEQLRAEINELKKKR